MTDKTLGAYTRTAPHPDDMDGGVAAARIEKEVEKIDRLTQDLAESEFARHPDGRIAACCVPDDPRSPWRSRRQYVHGDTDSLDDRWMAQQGWSPARECPDPDDHVLARDYAAMSDRATQWQERAEKAKEDATYWENTSRAQADALQRAQARTKKAEQAGEFAALWKETARRKHREARAYRTDASIEAARAFGLARAITTLRNRMFAAEQDRDETQEHLRNRTVDLVEATRDRDKARRERDVLAERVRDFADSIREQQKMIDRLGEERDEAIADQHMTADQHLAAAMAHGETVTDEMVERAWAAFVESPGWRIGTLHEDGPTVRRALAAALTEPPARHPEAERFDPIIDAAIRGHSDITDPAVVQAIADALAEEGVRAPEGGGAA